MVLDTLHRNSTNLAGGSPVGCFAHHLVTMSPMVGSRRFEVEALDVGVVCPADKVAVDVDGFSRRAFLEGGWSLWLLVVVAGLGWAGFGWPVGVCDVRGMCLCGSDSLGRTNLLLTVGDLGAGIDGLETGGRCCVGAAVGLEVGGRCCAGGLETGGHCCASDRETGGRCCADAAAADCCCRSIDNVGNIGGSSDTDWRSCS